MAINIPQGYNVTAAEPIDQRLILTKRQMKLLSGAAGMLPSMYFCLCADSDENGQHKIYVYDAKCPKEKEDPETGKYHVYLADVDDFSYNKLTDLPVLGDKPIKDTHDADYYGLQEKLSIARPIKLDDNLVSLLFDSETLGINTKGELYAKADTSGLEDEINRAKAREQAIEDALQREIARATGSEGDIAARLLAEILRAQTSEEQLRTALTEELQRAITSEGQLRVALNAEIQRAITSEGQIRTAYITADDILRTLINSEAVARVAKDVELEDRMVRGIKIDDTTVTYNTTTLDHYIHIDKGSTTNYGPVKLDGQTIILNTNDKIAVNKDDYTIKYDTADSKTKVNLMNVQKKLTEGDGIKLTSEGTYRDNIKVRFDNATIMLNDSEDLYVRDVLWAGPNSTKASLKDIIPTAAGGKRISDSEKINTLVDYDTLVDMISSNLGEFRGTFDSEGALEAAYPKGSCDKNDYAFVTIVTSEATYYDRYKCVDKLGDNWEYEFRIATSGFTAPQWKALQSMATKEDLEDLKAHLSNTNNPHHVTAAQLGLAAFKDKLIDSEAIAGSINPIASGAVKAALNEKQEDRTFIKYLLENDSEKTVEWELYDRVRKGTGENSLMIGDIANSDATGKNALAIGGSASSKSQANIENSVALIGGKVTSTVSTDKNGFAVFGNISRSSDSAVIGKSSTIGETSNNSSIIGPSNDIYNAKYATIVGSSGKIGQQGAAFDSNYSTILGGNGAYIYGNNATVIASRYSSAMRNANVIASENSFAYNSGIVIGSSNSYSNDVFGTIIIGSKYAYTKGSRSVTIGSSNASNLNNYSLVLAPSDDNYIVRLTGDANATTYTYGYGSNGDYMHTSDDMFGGTREDSLKYLIKESGASVYVQSNISESYTLSGTTVYPSGAKKWIKITDIDTDAKTIKTASTLSTSTVSSTQFKYTITNNDASNALIIGKLNYVSSNAHRSRVIGDINIVKDYNNYVFGKGLLSARTAYNADASMVIGRWNAKDSTKSFIIGNGTDKDNRRNALTIDTDNHVAIVTDPENDMDVVPYKMLHRIVRDTTSTSKTIAKVEKERTYVFGTLTSLTVNEFDSTGICDIIFKSGSTPTTVTLPSGTKLPKDFAWEANKTYELNVLDGLALIGVWE